MNKVQLEKKKHDDFIARAKKFLAEDPYWVYLLTMEGGRQQRRKVAQEFSKLMTTIPKIGDTDEKGNGKPDGLVLTRSIRRGLRAPQGRA